MINFKDISYLKDGNDKQRRAYLTINELNLFEILKDYNPLLAGTIPIEIEIESSDLDIICNAPDLKEFKKFLLINLIHLDQFEITEKKIRDRETVICRFSYNNFEFELFAQNRNPFENEAFRHMLIEYKLLEKHGFEFKNKIIELKKSGLKTEPAFAQLLNLEGDPYDELLLLESNLGLG